MNIEAKYSKEALVRVVAFATEHEDILDTTAAALVPSIKASIAEIDHLGGGQVAGAGVMRSGVDQRRDTAKELRQALVDIALTGRILDQGPNPGLGAELHVGKKKSYQALQDLATAFVTIVTPIKTAFTGRGFPMTFLDDLTALRDALATATDRKFGGLNEQMESTSGLILATRKGVALIRNLDANLRPQLRKNHPGLLDTWKAAVHVRSRKKSAQPPAAAGTSPAPAPASPTVTP